MQCMLGMRSAPPVDLSQWPPEAAALITQLQQQLQAQASEIAQREAQITRRDTEITQRDSEIARRDREIAWRDAKLEKVNFELARLKRWKFEAKTEAMTAQQRALFAETLFEDEASLRAKLAELQRGMPEAPAKPKAAPRQPRRQALPEHLRRVEHHHEPEDTTCPNAQCGQPMQRVGEDVSEKHAKSAGRVLCAPPHLRQVGLPLLPKERGRTPGAGAGRARGG